jgi:opacity protein-like surface antigen
MRGISMRKHVLALALGIAVGIAGSASATDLTGAAPPPWKSYSPEFSWAGAYFGLHGAAAGGASYDSDEPKVPLGGQYVGAQVGFSTIVGGSLLLGLEGDYSASSIHGFIQYIDLDDPLLADVTLTEQVRWIATLRGRVGLPMGHWMPYVTAGWARADSTRTTGELQTITLGHSGWTVGAGVELMLTPHWTVKGEYKYFSFGPMTYEWAVGGPSSVGFNFSTVEFGLNYRF